ncbi:MAG: NUDIX domain-containing protein [Candidatus Kerfeldbacteria bacterium]|nr:NUDIX domain-containing protein [Candidatus Kerfeldbacteria bacterium]
MENAQNNSVGVGVGVILEKDGKILLGRRHPDAKKAGSALHGEGTWTLPGGKIHFGETLEECARRETLEETGLTLGPLQIVSVADDIVYDAHYVTIGFVCREFHAEPRVMEPEKITKWRWFDPEHLPQPLFSASKRVIDNFLAGKIY